VPDGFYTTPGFPVDQGVCGLTLEQAQDVLPSILLVLVTAWGLRMVIKTVKGGE
jgi:hypothetical protein